MRGWRSVLVTAVAVALAAASLAGSPVASASGQTTIAAPAKASRSRTTAVTVRLPSQVVAIEGRVLLASAGGELIGLAPVGGGVALTPLVVDGGYAFGAFGLKPRNGRTSLRLIVVPHASAELEVRVVIDGAADARGRRLHISDRTLVSRLNVAGGRRFLAAPNRPVRPAPSRSAGPTRDLFPDGVISVDDLDIVRGAWYRTREQDMSCSPGPDVPADANGDGCVDVVDLQLLTADKGKPVIDPARPKPPVERRLTASIAEPLAPPGATLDAPLTYLVTSTADTPDASQGNGVCADSQGRCTLRAAIMESNWNSGVDRIHFNLIGTAPVRIQLGSPLPNVGSSSGGVVMDGYTQPGSQPNTTQFGTNAIPGVEIRGTGMSMTFAIYVPQAGSTFRGLLVNNVYRGIFLDSTSASGNRIVGNFLGFEADNSLLARAKAGVWLNTGARNNIIGSPALADRNVIGNYDKAVYSYGTGTNGNIVQNNVLCIRPNGLGATCQIAVDHDFGPKASLIGGTGPNERNVSGPTTINGVEFSHGWNPANSDGSVAWQINDHRVIGNWIGFRQDGSYDPAFRSAQNIPTFDNGQGVHFFDGANNNLAEGNHIAAVYDGVTIAMNNSTGNIIRNNIIGESPLGQPAPLARWGIYFILNTQVHTVEGNIIRNAAQGGIMLLDFNVRRIRISRNIVTNTNGPAIHLEPDANAPTTGANALLPAPSFATASETQASGTGISGATVEVYQASRASGQQGLPIAYLGSTVVAANGTWSRAFSSPLQTGDRVTALQIRTNGDTSALAPNVFAGGPPPQPVADFSWSQRAGSVILDFSDTSTGSPTTWSWTFGDGTSSTQQHPTKTYAVGGDYTVRLTATNESGSNTRTRTVSVSPLPPGTVLASDTFTRTSNSSWDSADVGGAYTLDPDVTNFSVAGGTGNVVLPAVDANRGATLNAVSARDVDLRFRVRTSKGAASGPHYAYGLVRQNGGNAYRPKLIMFSNGTVAVHTGVLINNAESSLAPSVVVPGLSHTANSFIWLRAEVTGASPTTIRLKAWADGQSEPSGWHYTVTSSHAAVQVAGATGLRAYMSSNNPPVTFNFDDFLVRTPGTPVPPPPPPAPVADFTSSQQPDTLKVDYTDASTGTPTSWLWDFGDGTGSTQQHPTKTYAAGGDYTVSLTATNATGSDTRTRTVDVITPPPPPPEPVADFTASQRPETLIVDFSDDSTGSPTSWLWDFGDGTGSTQQDPTKSYAAGGDYLVTLTVTSAGGSDETAQTVDVVQPAITTYASDAFGRTSTNSWGSADIGGTYTLQGTAADFDVAGGVGTIVMPNAGANRSTLLTTVSARDVDVRFRVRASKVAAGNAYFVYAVTRRNGNNAYRPKIILHPNGSVSVHAGVLINNAESSTGPAVLVPGLTQSANAFIWVRAQVTGASPTTIRVKAWAGGQPEPAGWQFTSTNSASAVQTAGGVGLRTYVDSGSNAPVTFGFDDFSVTNP